MFKGQAVNEMSETSYQCMLRNIPEEKGSHSERGGSLQSWITVPVIFQIWNLYSYLKE
jgi:hypothetical protein